MNQQNSVMIWKYMAWVCLADPGPSQCNHHEHTHEKSVLWSGNISGQGTCHYMHGQYLHIADVRRMWTNDSTVFFINQNIKGLQWFNFLVKRTLGWWMLAWLFAISGNVGGTVFHTRDWFNKPDLHCNCKSHIHVTLNHQHPFLMCSNVLVQTVD